MPTIAQIAREISTRTVTIRGTSHAVRAVTAGEAALLELACPRPVAPPGPDPSAGSGAPWVICYHDAGYQRELNRWRSKMTTIESAVGIGLLVDDKAFLASMTVAEAAAWCARAMSDMGSLTPEELAAIRNAADGAAGEALVEAARKN